MKALKLHHKSDIIEFISDCVRITDAAPHGVKFDTELLSDLLQRGKVKKIWSILSTNRTLWNDGYSILLKPVTRLTFVKYREMSKFERKTQLTRTLKENK